MTVGITDTQRVPGIHRALIVSVKANDHTTGVESKPRAQRFEGALFRAPKQSQKPKPVRRKRVRNQRLLFDGEIIGNKCVAARLDDFQITAQRCPDGATAQAAMPARWLSEMARPLACS